MEKMLTEREVLVYLNEAGIPRGIHWLRSLRRKGSKIPPPPAYTPGGTGKSYLYLPKEVDAWAKKHLLVRV